ncbi:hypothetical protein JHK82_041046 [Glycine max]|uniref:Uncharacterized protein n=1 Tax=Glycine soja TaxID=3848 RepID=A0A0B2QM15_GLYSO|nr:hypothetical protein JHK82_041046 [Glycine max]KHN22456.1 hypothetical protein glysoja_024965 [Glycine soja]
MIANYKKEQGFKKRSVRVIWAATSRFFLSVQDGNAAAIGTASAVFVCDITNVTKSQRDRNRYLKP